MNRCPSSDRLEQFLGALLNADESTAVESHVDGCRTCQLQLHEMSADDIAKRVRHLQAEEEQLVQLLPPEFFERLADRVPMDVERAEGSDCGYSSSDGARHAEERYAEEFPVVRGYEVIDELGRGGMGVVYLARQQGLNRLVALKVILSGARARAEDLERFRIEAEAIARQSHPNIEQIYEVGEYDGRPYMALEYLEGGSLAKKFGNTPQPPRQAAQLVETLARAMHAAHQAGVIHRDLKPSNVLLQRITGRESRLRNDPRSGTPHSLHAPLSAFCPKITDFGLARLLPGSGAVWDASDEEPEASPARNFLGSPSYMAPEQAGGTMREITPATDTYALGAILYEGITGRPPFKAATAADTVLQVVTEQPVSPRQLQPQCPRDLETITLKCLNKDARARYATAEALADDLRRFLDDEPIEARPAGPLEKLIKWGRHRPAVAGLLVAIVLVTVLGFYGVTSQWLRAEAKARSETALKVLMEKHRDQAEAAREEAVDAQQATEIALYFSRIAQAHLHWNNHHVSAAIGLLDRYAAGQPQSDLRGWEWFYLRRLFHSEQRSLDDHQFWVNGLAFNPEGDRLAVSTGAPGQGLGNPLTDGEVKVWEPHSGRLVHAAASPCGSLKTTVFSPDGGRLLATGCAGGSALWGMDAFAAQALPPSQMLAVRHDLTVAAVAAEDALELWELDSGKLLRRLEGLGGPLAHALFTADGRQLVAATAEGKVGVWNTDETQPRRTIVSHPISQMALSPAGRYLACSPREGALVSVLELHSGQVVAAFSTHFEPRQMTFSPDLSYLAAAEHDHVTIWNLASDRDHDRRQLYGHNGLVNAFALSPDGQYLATAGRDQTVRVWEAATGRELRIYRGHTSGVLCVTFSSDGSRLASGGQDGSVKLWDWKVDPRGYHLANPLKAGEYLGGLSFSSDGREVVAIRSLTWLKGSVEGGTLIPQEELPWHDVRDTNPADIVFSADGRFLAATARHPQEVGIWDTQTGKELQMLVGHSVPLVRCVALSRDHRRAATAGDIVAPKAEAPTSELLVWDTASGQVLSRFTLPAITRLAMDSRGRRVVTAGPDFQLRIWDTATGKETACAGRHQDQIAGLAFSPDGETFASVGFRDRQLNLWRAPDGAPLHSGPLDAPQDLTCVTFSPDGRRVAATGYDGQITLWDLASGHEVLSLRGFAPYRPGVYAYPARVVFSSDGKRIASNNWDASINVWDSDRREPGARAAAVPGKP